ncbi:MAG: hypothetical protein CMM07_00140 [Rhodopirellula sp.]|nr:hypothetical protein [Rhodopirellula sp.]
MIKHGSSIIYKGKSVRKLVPLILIIVAGCGSTGRNIFRPTSKAGCAQAPCDSSCGCIEPTGQVILNEYPLPEKAIQSE